MYSKVLIGLDGSQHALKAAGVGAEIAAKFGAELHLVTVTRPYRVTPELRRFLQAEDLMGEPKYVLDQMTKNILSGAIKSAEAAGVKEAQSHVLEGKPARVLTDYARDHDFDLIVVGTRGVGEIEAALLGSVSHKVTSLAHCTVLVVR